jgi:probable rRNA maturation factor
MSVFLANEQAMEVDAAEFRGLAELVLGEEGYPPSTELTILLVEDEEMAGYNRRFLDRDEPTDVLSFPVEQLIPGLVPDVDEHGPPLMAGDVVIAPAVVARHAESNGTSFGDEMALIVTHGILHLLGYDHEDDRDADLMERRERELLAKTGRVRR